MPRQEYLSVFGAVGAGEQGEPAEYPKGRGPLVSVDEAAQEGPALDPLLG